MEEPAPDGGIQGSGGEKGRRNGDRIKNGVVKVKAADKVFFWAVTFFLVPALFFGCGKGVAIETQYEGNRSLADPSDVYDVLEVDDIPAAYILKNDGHFDYQPGLECSAFASAYLLRHFGEEANGLELFKTFPHKLPDGEGVYPSGIVNLFHERGGYTAEFKINGTVEELKKLVATGAPVIVFIHVEEPYETTHNTHYLPLIGYDEDYFYFAESLEYLANCKDETDLGYNRRTEIAKFERLWSNIDGMWDNPYFIIGPIE